MDARSQRAGLAFSATALTAFYASAGRDGDLLTSDGPALGGWLAALEGRGCFAGLRLAFTIPSVAGAARPRLMILSLQKHGQPPDSLRRGCVWGGGQKSAA